jgi:glycine oxidase
MGRSCGKSSVCSRTFSFSRVFYNAMVKTWDVIVIGGGIIGLSLASELRKHGASVVVVERGEPGREASHAAGGMIVDCPAETAPALRELATASAQMYPEFARELEIESGINVDLRDEGAIVFPAPERVDEFASERPLPVPLAEFEPALAAQERPAYFLQERWVEPRALTSAALGTAKRRGVDVSSGEDVVALKVSDGRASGVVTKKTEFVANKVVNCAGAWSGQIAPHSFPTRPVKGQMLYLLSPSRNLLKHVIRAPEAYLIPRSDGRILVGTTTEEAGFDKTTDVSTIQRLRQAATSLIPELRNAKILEDWAGLRPGTPDALPIMGETSTPGYYVATGHFRDGIMLAPITARIMVNVIDGKNCGYDLKPFSPARFQT